MMAFDEGGMRIGFGQTNQRQTAREKRLDCSGLKKALEIGKDTKGDLRL